MKKILVSYLIVSLFLFHNVVSASSPSDNSVRIIVNGEETEFSPAAFIANGNTMVPFRQIFEIYGAVVEWDADTGIIIASKADTMITIKVDSFEAYINDQKIILTQTPGIVYGHAYVNLRFISEALGSKVTFEKKLKPTVYIEY